MDRAIFPRYHLFAVGSRGSTERKLSTLLILPCRPGEISLRASSVRCGSRALRPPFSPISAKLSNVGAPRGTACYPFLRVLLRAFHLCMYLLRRRRNDISIARKLADALHNVSCIRSVAFRRRWENLEEVSRNLNRLGLRRDVRCSYTGRSAARWTRTRFFSFLFRPIVRSSPIGSLDRDQSIVNDGAIVTGVTRLGGKEFEYHER